MKIVIINAVYKVGSTGSIVYDIEQSCKEQGIDSIVVYTVPCSQSRSLNDYVIGSYVENKLHALLSRISGKQGYFSCFATKSFLKFLDYYKPDIVHLHNLHGCFINLPLLLQYLSDNNIATVVTLHDCWFYTGGCTHYTASGCNRWKSTCGKCPRRYEEFQAYLWDSSKRQLADRKKLFGSIKKMAVVGVSDWIKEEACLTVFKNARSLTIRNGIDVRFFHPVDASKLRKKLQLEKKFVVLAPANKWFMKVNRETLNYFIDMLTEDMIMLFIGRGVDERFLKGNMLNLGFIQSREDIREIYSSADVMINCTREESLSLLNVEVQACGTPVITYSNTGVKETVDGQCGFAVENGNPQALWEQMQIVKRNTKSFYSGKCVRWAYEEFDKNKNYQKYIELYKSMI